MAKNYSISDVVKSASALIDTIKDYESDTFSASGSSITDEEATQIALRFILGHIDGLVEARTMDGVMLSDALSDIRDNAKDEEKTSV